ncbi:pth11-like integral membrane protein [Apiospora arundinis]|uniref:Pth11-like integral membrane protein n=1 Tax=Apiospora arundinis TaxID=335852 RepID=A0ABR2I496_9PEZI
MSSPRLTTSFITCEPFLPTDCHTTQRRVCSYVCISPNMELPAENGVHVWRCAVVMPCITLLFVVARFYSRIALMKKGLGKDDYIIGITFVFLVAYSILIAIAASNGLGLHSRQYTDDTLSRYYKYVGIATEMSLLASMGFKMSLLLLYLKLAGSKRKLQWTVYAAMVWVVDWLIANMVAGGMQCWPRDKKWEKDEMGWCVQSNAVGVVFGAGNVSSNLVLAMIPVALIWRKRLLRMKERIEFGVVVSSGLLAFSFAVANWAVAIHTLNVEDKTWWTGVRFVLSIFEVHTGMICACIAGASQLLSTPRPAAPETIPTLNYWPSPSAPSLQQTLQSRNQSFQTWQSLVSPVSSYPSSVRTATPLPIQVEFEGAQSRDQRSLRAQREVKSIYELDGSVPVIRNTDIPAAGLSRNDPWPLWEKEFLGKRIIPFRPEGRLRWGSAGGGPSRLGRILGTAAAAPILTHARNQNRAGLPTCRDPYSRDQQFGKKTSTPYSYSAPQTYAVDGGVGQSASHSSADETCNQKAHPIEAKTTTTTATGAVANVDTTTSISTWIPE